MEDLERVLSTQTTDQGEFLRSIMDVLTESAWKTATISDPRSLYKALAYICGWVYYPAYPELLSALPRHIVTLRERLHCEVSGIKPLCGRFYREICSEDSGYSPEFVDIFTAPWTVSLLLLDKESGDWTVELPVGLKIPALLFILTYVPSLRGAIAQQLSEAVIHPDGVYTLIQAFAVGENKEAMRDLAVKVLRAVPRSVGVERYWESIGKQCLGMLTEWQCELYFRSISLFLSTFQPLLHSSGPALTRCLHALHALSQPSPPCRLLLYLLESDFPSIYALDICAQQYPALAVTKDIREILVQFCRYSPSASPILYSAFISGPGLSSSYQLSDSDFLPVPADTLALEPAVSNLSHNISLLACLSKDRLSAKVCSEVFSLLLTEYTAEWSTIPLLYISAVAETLPGDVLVNSAEQLVAFMRAALGDAADWEMWGIAMKLVCAVLKEDEKAIEPHFLIEISKKIIEFTHCDITEIADIAKETNLLISKSIHRNQSATPTSKDSKDMIQPQLVAALRGPVPFERAFALHQISLLPPFQLKSPQVTTEMLRILADPDTFVFQNVLKLAVRVAKVSLTDTLAGLFSAYRSNSDIVSKSHIFEVIFHIIISLGRVTVYTAAPSLMEFLTSTQETEEMLISGKMSVMAELAKYLGPGLHPYVNYMIGMAIAEVKSGMSQVFLKREKLGTMGAALVVIDKIMKNSPLEHILPRLSEIRDILQTLYSLYADDDSTKSLLIQALDSTELQYSKQFGLRPTD